MLAKGPRESRLACVPEFEPSLMDSVFEHSAHGATSFQVLGSYWLTFKAVANDDFSKRFLRSVIFSDRQRE